MPDKPYLLGIDIGGTKLAVVIADNQGRLLHKIRQPTQAYQGGRAVLDKILALVHQILAESGLKPADVACIGVSCPGPVDTKTGLIHSPPNLPGWGEIRLKTILEQEFGILAKFENDANAAALAEMMFGAGINHKNMIYLTMSTGIGGGIIINQRLYRGTHGSAGEVGHQILIPDGPLCGCGRRGCLEALCSGTAISKLMQKAAQDHPESLINSLAANKPENMAPPVLVRAAQAKDELALDLWRQIGYYLGWGLANLTNVLDPEIFILGTIAINAGELLLTPARETLSRYIFNRNIPMPDLILAKLGGEIGEYGAIAIAQATEDNN
jgi:glucokinase